MINLNDDTYRILFSRHISFLYYYILPLFSRICNAQTANSSHLVYNLNHSSRKIRCARENRHRLPMLSCKSARKRASFAPPNSTKLNA